MADVGVGDKAEGGLSKVEIEKKESNHLRGTIAEVLAGDATKFEHADQVALKFHGVYQQDDRDARKAAAGQEKQYTFMVRMRIPGGRLTAEQYVQCDELATKYSTGGLRITTRQAFQFHGVLKGNLKAAIAGINKALLTTVAACGDIERNVMATPAPVKTRGYVEVQQLANDIADALRPKTNAYYEIWLDGEKVQSTENEEPFYGDTYLPRKFKTGVTLPWDNTIDIYTQDLGFIADVDLAAKKLRGANILVGGGLGMSHGKGETYARLGTVLGYVDAPHVIDAAKTVVAIFRDMGNRADRKIARLKYLVEKIGMDGVREEFNKRLPGVLQPARELGKLEYNDWLGAHEQGDGKYFYGVYVPSGRLKDTPEKKRKTAVRAIVDTVKAPSVLLPSQDILFYDLTAENVKQIEAILDEFGLEHPKNLTGVRRFHLACPALPTCGLALAESERAMPDLIATFEKELAALGLDNEPIGIRMTGCPNGCARPYTSDIALVGRAPNIYDVYVGGRLAGDRLVVLYAEKVKFSDVAGVVRPLLEAWKSERQPKEGFGDWYNRTRLAGQPTRIILTGAKDPAWKPAAKGASPE